MASVQKLLSMKPPSFPLSSRPGFPATLRWTRLRVRLSRKERRIKFANATNLNRKSGGAKPRDLRFCGPLLETRNEKGEVGVSRRIGDDWWRLWAGRSGAHEWRTADPSPSPDFLSRVAASVSCVWFSLERTTSVVAGESSEAGNPGTLGMTKRRGSLQGKGGC